MSAATTFHCFSSLPLELREEIWMYCLPERVCELDTPSTGSLSRLCRNHESYCPTIGPDLKPLPPNARDIVDGVPPTCDLHYTTTLNGRPPVITRVCYESRSVALKAGRVSSIADIDRSAAGRLWSSKRRIWEGWHDQLRDSVHLNWHMCDDEDDRKLWRTDVLNALAFTAQHFANTSSFTMLAINRNYHWLLPSPDQSQPIWFRMPGFDGFTSYMLQQRPLWHVVMQIVIVHCDPCVARNSGLFGLLGDAPVQVIDASHSDRLDTYFRFAQRCEREHPVTVHQDFTPPSADEMQQHLEVTIMKRWPHESEYGVDLARKMRPAIMFRLCPHLCTYAGSDDAENEYERAGAAKEWRAQSQRSDRGRANRGRGRGRGDGRGRGSGCGRGQGSGHSLMSTD